MLSGVGHLPPQWATCFSASALCENIFLRSSLNLPSLVQSHLSLACCNRPCYKVCPCLSYRLCHDIFPGAFSSPSSTAPALSPISRGNLCDQLLWPPLDFSCPSRVERSSWAVLQVRSMPTKGSSLAFLQLNCN